MDLGLISNRAKRYRRDVVLSHVATTTKTDHHGESFHCFITLGQPGFLKHLNFSGNASNINPTNGAITSLYYEDVVDV